VSFGDDIGKEFSKINRKRDRTIKSAALNLYGDLIVASPVDTGELKRSWQLPLKRGRYTWAITNIAPHAIVIDGGIRPIPMNGKLKIVGSQQLPWGFSPIVKKTEKALQKELNR